MARAGVTDLGAGRMGQGLAAGAPAEPAGLADLQDAGIRWSHRSPPPRTIGATPARAGLVLLAVPDDAIARRGRGARPRTGRRGATTSCCTSPDCWTAAPSAPSPAPARRSAPFTRCNDLPIRRPLPSGCGRLCRPRRGRACPRRRASGWPARSGCAGATRARPPRRPIMPERRSPPTTRSCWPPWPNDWRAGRGAPRRGAALYLPLIRGDGRQSGRSGPAAALTGPVRRGDAETVAAHLAALAPGDRGALPPARPARRSGWRGRRGSPAEPPTGSRGRWGWRPGRAESKLSTALEPLLCSILPIHPLTRSAWRDGGRSFQRPRWSPASPVAGSSSAGCRSAATSTSRPGCSRR